MNNSLTQDEREILLALARQALEDGVHGRPLHPLDLSSLPQRLKAPGASFVTLSRGGELRGCVGSLEAYQPLAEDVRIHAIAAGLQDYRFPPVDPKELPEITIEISRLTEPEVLDYDTSEELPQRLRPNIDGVILRDGALRATFLPQVWEKLPDAAQFLGHLCMKMGLEPNHWRYRKMQVLTYQVESFGE